MRTYALIKVFNLAKAPHDLRQAAEFADLQPKPGDLDQPIFTIRAGQYGSLVAEPAGGETRERTLAEYQLHQWLLESGAEIGEEVMVYWKPDEVSLVSDGLEATAITASTKRSMSSSPVR